MDLITLYRESRQNDLSINHQIAAFKTVKAVYAEGGIPAFWRGLTASLLGLGHVAIQFPVYEVTYVPERGGLIAFTPFIDATFLLLTPTFLLRHHLQSPF